jgi:hypothetical protein
MSVSVALEFALPGQPDIVSVSIYESPTAEGPFRHIETITDVGQFRLTSTITRPTLQTALTTGLQFRGLM